MSFKSIEELQGQNQRLLAVVRELSEEKEKEEKKERDEAVRELQQQLNITTK